MHPEQIEMHSSESMRTQSHRDVVVVNGAWMSEGVVLQQDQIGNATCIQASFLINEPEECSLDAV